jgi:enoyl-CoA hydratase/carnithine racemase
MAEPLTRVERVSPQIAVLTLARAERRNALSIAMRDEITAHLGALAADPELMVVVVTGEGDVFSAGFDLREFEQAAADVAFGEALWASSDRYHDAVAQFPLVTIAAVNGPAIAGGFDLAVLCDLRVATTTARFAHPEYTFGDVVYGPLHDLVGGALARELCMTGRVLGAEEALAANLVSAVVAPEELRESALALAGRVAAADRAALRRTKAKALARAREHGGGTLDR